MEQKWYVVRTFSGHETKVKNLLESEMRDNERVKAKISDIVVPTERVFEVKDGKKNSKNKKFLSRVRFSSSRTGYPGERVYFKYTVCYGFFR